jgi:16S rRNA (uracil1498-N3)-methyltransferase
MKEAWFFHDPVPPAGERLNLDRSEAAHALGPLRLAAGATVRVFDGQGTTAVAEIAARPERASPCTLIVRDRVFSGRPAPSVHVVSAVPRGDRTAVLVSMITQLGAASFRPLMTERSVAEPGKRAAERWRRIMIEACKQARQPWLPALEERVDVAGLADLIGAAGGETCWLLAHPGGTPAAGAVRTARPRDLAFVIGPEGGLSDEEVERLTARGAIQVSLGASILRIETAATVAAALGLLA